MRTRMISLQGLWVGARRRNTARRAVATPGPDYSAMLVPVMLIACLVLELVAIGGFTAVWVGEARTTGGHRPPLQQGAR
jgi:hypothetical protein